MKELYSGPLDDEVDEEEHDVPDLFKQKFGGTFSRGARNVCICTIRRASSFSLTRSRGELMRDELVFLARSSPNPKFRSHFWRTEIETDFGQKSHLESVLLVG